jgi:probable addiction module antidote protein
MQFSGSERRPALRIFSGNRAVSKPGFLRSRHPKEINMDKITTRPYDIAEKLEDDAYVVLYIQAAFEDGDPAVIVNAIGNIARARGMSRIARSTGLGRANLYRALSPEGNPEFFTILKVIKALGIRLYVDTR